MSDRPRDIVYLQVESDLLKTPDEHNWFERFELACDDAFDAHHHDHRKLRDALLGVATAAIGWIEAIDGSA